jgi:glycosyltransferase involved in cell wall biosynthesis
MPEARVSVILPTYNRAQFIERAIDSVFAQTYQDFELIIVDDGSTDHTPDIVRSYSDDRIRYLNLVRNKGAAAARNAGIRHAKGIFLAFQDSDDEWLPDKLRKQVDVMNTDPQLCVVYGDMERILASGETQPFPAPDVQYGRILDPLTGFYQVHNIGIQSALIRRTLLDLDPPFDERLPMLEDMELFLRLAIHRRFHHLRSCVVRYYETQGLSANDYKRTIARRWLLKLHGPLIRKTHPVFFLREWINVSRYTLSYKVLST